jgi:hypothetical protein
MDENSFIYGTQNDADDKVLVKMYVPKHLKTRLDTLKLISGRKLQELGAEALEEYLNKQMAHWVSKREAVLTSA